MGQMFHLYLYSGYFGWLSTNFINIKMENKVIEIDPYMPTISVSVRELNASIKRSSIFESHLTNTWVKEKIENI